MHSTFNIREFLPLSHPLSCFRRIRDNRDPKTKFVLDLEDSVADFDSISRTRLLKQQARRDLHRVLEKLGSSPPPIAVRINAVRSAHYQEDIACLSQLRHYHHPIEIVISKAETLLDLQNCSTDILQAIGRPLPLHPILETRKGVKNAETLCEYCANTHDTPSSMDVYFGMFDYSLDAGFWPIPDPQTALYWESVEPAITLCQRNHYTYIHPPPTDLTNEGELSAILSQLATKQLDHLGFSSLSLGQTQTIKACKPCRAKPTSPPLITKAHNRDDLIRMAHHTIHSFEAHRARKRSFSTHKGHFIPPQMYQAALNHIKSSHHHS